MAIILCAKHNMLVDYLLHIYYFVSLNALCLLTCPSLSPLPTSNH